MAYFKSSGSTSASDILESSSLELSLPSSALSVPGIAVLLGVSGRPSPRPSSDLASRVILREIGWEWETESIDFFDEDGCADSREVKDDFTIDSNMVRNLYSMQEKVVDALSALGIPFDSKLVDSVGGEERARFARLSAGSEAFAPSRTLDGKTELTAEELHDLMAEAEDLAELRSWVAEREERPEPLRMSSALFDEHMAEAGAIEFLDASAKLLDWLGAGVHSQYGQPKWNNFSPSWLLPRWNGLSPMDRLVELGIALPRQRIFDLARTSIDQGDSLDPSCIGAFLGAYCASASAYATRAPLDGAELASICIAACPQAVNFMHAKAKRFFDLDLAPHPQPDTEQAALAEAHWLRAQSFIAREIYEPAQATPARRL